MKKKIMIVDDNPDLLYMVKKGLKRLSEDCEITSVQSAKECFKTLEKGNMPDLILLDIMMPEMNGWDVLVKIKSEAAWEKIPVIFLTAKTDDTSKGFGILTSEGYITKPFRLEKLKEKIDTILNRGIKND